MNVADSSAFMEYFSNGPNAAFFEPIIVATTELVVPTISIYEVFKKISLIESIDAAEEAVVLMRRGHVVDLDLDLALSAAKRSIEYQLSMADAIIYATAQFHSATLWTQDQHFENLPGVMYKAKP